MLFRLRNIKINKFKTALEREIFYAYLEVFEHYYHLEQQISLPQGYVLLKLPPTFITQAIYKLQALSTPQVNP